MKVTDEILNRLIDNELNDREIEELHQLIKYDEVALSKVKAHQMVDSILKKIDVDLAPEDTTSRIMERISKSLLVKESKNGFFKFIISFFVLMIVFIVGYMISIFSKTYSPSTPSKYSKVVDKIINLFASFNITLDNELILIVGGVLTVMLLISGYFVFEEHRSFKHKLENYF
jgi:hypothetical protein